MPRGKAIPLTDAKILAAPVGNNWDSVQPGLLVTTNKRRRQTFRVRYDLEGKQRFKTLTPDYPMLPLDKARRMAADIREKAKDGAPATIAGDFTVDTVVDEFLRLPRYPLSKLSKVYKEQWWQRYMRSFTGTIGRCDPGSIPQQVLMDIVEEAIDNGKTGEAQSLRTWVGSFYKNLAYHRHYKGANIATNPIAGQRFTEYEFPERTPLTEDQIRDFYLEDPLYNALAQLLLFTGQRIGNVLTLRWNSIADGVWVVGEKGEMKNKKSAHHLPWLDEYEELVEPFRNNGSEYVFTIDGRRPISHTAINETLKKHMEGLTPHKFRHTLLSHMPKVTHPYNCPLIAHHSSDAQRNNTSEQVYMHGQQIERKREALQAYADFIFQLRCSFQPYPEAQDYAAEQGIERGNFDAPANPITDILDSLTDEQRAALEPLLPKETTVSRANQARVMQRASIATDYAYLVEAAAETHADAVANLSKKYHLPVASLQSIIHGLPASPADLQCR